MLNVKYREDKTHWTDTHEWKLYLPNKHRDNRKLIVQVMSRVWWREYFSTWKIQKTKVASYASCFRLEMYIFDCIF